MLDYEKIHAGVKANNFSYGTFVRDVSAERRRQVKKFGPQSHSNEKWTVILTEEVGEVARAVYEGDKDNLREELVQVAAVAAAWLEDIDSRGSNESDELYPESGTVRYEDVVRSAMRLHPQLTRGDFKSPAEWLRSPFSFVVPALLKAQVRIGREATARAEAMKKRLDYSYERNFVKHYLFKVSPLDYGFLPPMRSDCL